MEYFLLIRMPAEHPGGERDPDKPHVYEARYESQFMGGGETEPVAVL
jgi:hypothetical protein